MIQLSKTTISEVKMAKKRYVNTRDQSFFGNYIYDQVVPQNHFLRLLNRLIDWYRFTERIIELYRGGENMAGHLSTRCNSSKCAC